MLTLQPRQAGGRHEVVVVRALALGDLICAGPAFRAVRAALPEARIQLIGQPRMRELARRFRGEFDGLLEFPGFPGIPEVDFRAETLQRFVSQVLRLDLDLAINLHGDGVRSSFFTALLGARRMAGPWLPGTWLPDSETFSAYPGHAHEIHRCLAVTDGLGYPRVDDDRLAFPVTDHDHASARVALGHRLPPPGTYAVVHPGASIAARRWSRDGFAAAATRLGERGLTVVLTGARGERAITAGVAKATRGRVLDLGGETSLGTLATLVDGARLVVTNDTSVSHIAAARRRPSVVLFTASDPERWAPLDRVRHVALGAGWPEGCGPGGQPACDHPGCRAAMERLERAAMDEPPTAAEIDVEVVLATIERQLERFAADAPAAPAAAYRPASQVGRQAARTPVASAR